MVLADLDKRTELTVWPSSAPAHTARGQAFSTLREALVAAVKSIQADDAQPWIITDNGDILSPRWIRANADPRRLQ
ncbi:hypothetical protein FV232_04745 [Methylobacterium sp. WL30]|uniref:hypothetical protein n=1 Tax=unclassified Methylobacterium TaxID=2615210 RepID=UPI0011C90D70|nr:MULTISPECIES: hypothetical protein [unclassified Methylobacterium]TXN41560.1 hypothetical protein FV225_02155 [Methylobacterium sp. WL93]TXN52431.1 hypothetical protein FV227_03025 [Methylobacterium sp. WL119]TXN69764.1 hypothetical protein FV232_04745 [Methylobacterium sp. WL30]